MLSSGWESLSFFAPFTTVPGAEPFPLFLSWSAKIAMFIPSRFRAQHYAATCLPTHTYDQTRFFDIFKLPSILVLEQQKLLVVEQEKQSVPLRVCSCLIGMCAHGLSSPV